MFSVNMCLVCDISQDFENFATEKNQGILSEEKICQCMKGVGGAQRNIRAHNLFSSSFFWC